MKKVFLFCMLCAIAFVSCKKDVIGDPNKDVVKVKTDTTKTDTLEVFKKWMDEHTQKQRWNDGDTSQFDWLTPEILFNRVAIINGSYNHGISYRYIPLPEFFPSINQHSQGGHVRFITIGDRSNLCPSFYHEVDYIVTLTVITSTGEVFVWKNCPIRVSYQLDANKNYHWIGNEAITEITVKAQGKI